MPERFERLNAAEKAFLGQRVEARRGNLARHVRELWELIPPNPEQFDMLFRAALHSGALEEGTATDDFALTRGTGAVDFYSDIPGSASGRFKAAQQKGAAPTGLGLSAGSITHHGLLNREARPAMERVREALGEKEAELSVMDEAKGLKAIPTEGESDTAVTHWNFRNSAMLAERGGQRHLFVPLDKTEEWAESSYYRLPVGDEHPDLVPVNTFWKDYAAWDGKEAFLSGHFYEAYSSLPDMLFAMAVLDLPFKAEAPEAERADGAIALRVEEPVIVFHQEVRESKDPDARTPVLVSQNFFRADDRYRHEDNERFDKFVTEEFLPARWSTGAR